MARALCTADAYLPGLRAVGGYRLPGARLPFPASVRSDAEWQALMAGARDHRVCGLLNAAVQDGAFPATDDQARMVRAVHRSEVMRTMFLERELGSLVDLLDAHDVDHRVLKGVAVARLDHADPVLRSFVDLDVLVRGRDVDRAVAVLGAAGFVRTLAEPRKGFDRRFDKGMTLRPSAGYELDLHRTFVLGPWGAVIDPDRLWSKWDEFDLNGRQVRALGQPFRLLHACYHAALGDWPLRLSSLRDVLVMLAGASESGGIRELAQSWGVSAVVAAAIADAERLLGIEPMGDLSNWAHTFVPSRRDERWLALHTTPDKTFAAQAIATVRMLPGWRSKGAYLAALLFPDSSYMADRHRTFGARLAYALAQVRKGRPRSG